MQEVVGLRKQGLTTEMQAGKAIGYRSTLEFLDKLEALPRSDKKGADSLFRQYITDYQTSMRFVFQLHLRGFVCLNVLSPSSSHPQELRQETMAMV